MSGFGQKGAEMSDFQTKEHIWEELRNVGRALGSSNGALPDEAETANRRAEPGGTPSGKPDASAQQDKPGRRGFAKNRNAQRSIKLLHAAFSELLAEKPYEKITVSDITRRADLSRGTFYAHFDSIDDLGSSVFADIVETLFIIKDAAPGESFLRNPQPALQLAGEYLMRDIDLYRQLARIRQADAFLRIMKERLAQYIYQQASCDPKAPDRTRLGIVVNYVAGGLFDVYLAWLKGDLGDIPVEKVNELAGRLVMSNAR